MAKNYDGMAVGVFELDNLVWVAFSSDCNIICFRNSYNFWLVFRHIKFFVLFLKIKSHDYLHKFRFVKYTSVSIFLPYGQEASLALKSSVNSHMFRFFSSHLLLKMKHYLLYFKFSIPQYNEPTQEQYQNVLNHAAYA